MYGLLLLRPLGRYLWALQACDTSFSIADCRTMLFVDIATTLSPLPTNEAADHVRHIGAEPSSSRPVGFVA